jgi:hypothetical protein
MGPSSHHRAATGSAQVLAELDGPKRRFLAGASLRRSGFEVEGARRTAKRRFRGDAETVQDLDIPRLEPVQGKPHEVGRVVHRALGEHDPGALCIVRHRLGGGDPGNEGSDEGSLAGQFQPDAIGQAALYGFCGGLGGVAVNAGPGRGGQDVEVGSVRLESPHLHEDREFP